LDLRENVNIKISVYGSTAFVDLGPLFSFLIYTQLERILERGISPSQGPLPTHKHGINAQTSMPRVVFEPMIPVFELARTVRALDCAVTVIGKY
jgi:hypothetical protein